ncbi:MAG: hypothetical protein H6810_01595 [Phycisphaeraceae bacterium]|nr:MAG: hypothetical protein H6810_01595 [Phycisphaeraceae bacterium]
MTSALGPFAFFGGAGLAFAGYLMLGRVHWMTPAVRASIVTLIFLALMIAVGRVAVRSYRRAMSAFRLPMELAPLVDVNVICWEDQAQRLELLRPADDDDGAFEPEVFRAWFARRRSFASRMLDKRERVWVRLKTGVLLLLCHPVFLVFAFIFIGAPPQLGVLALALLAPVFWSFIHPTYLRVAPGRVDIVRFGLFGVRARVEPYDLRAVPVRLDLRRRELLLGGWDPSHMSADDGPEEQPDDEWRRMVGDGPGFRDPQGRLGSPTQLRRQVIILLWCTMRPSLLEETVFRAATSTATPGPLPDDALLD